MFSQSYTVKFIFDGKKYDVLKLDAYQIDHKTISFYAIIDTIKNTYTFNIPDSVGQLMYCYSLNGPYNEKEKVLYSPDLVTIKNGDSVRLRTFVFDPKFKIIHGKYIGSKTVKNVYVKDQLSSICFDSFQFDYPTNTEWDVELQHPIFSFFYSQNEAEKKFTYNDFVLQYELTVKQHPSSNYLLSFLCAASNRYKSKEDIERVFSGFSEKLKNTAIGDTLQKFIRDYPSITAFSNDTLVDCETGKSERIVEDTSKFNMVIFSASWCAPCHLQIPLLKEMYGQLKSKLVMTYISLDTMSQVSTWKTLIHEKEIPWRSLLTGGQLARIKSKYFAYSIPRSLLIYPGGRKMEVIDVRLSADKEKLYKLLK